MDVAASPARAGRLEHVEGLRAFAALVVLFNHAYAQIWTDFYGQFPPRWLSWTTGSLVCGHLAVSVFIVISGFCLMLPVARAGGTLRSGAATFFRKRARRILPPYYAALGLALLLIHTVLGEPTRTLWDVCIAFDWRAVVAHLTLVHDFFGTGRINYAFWSIAVEWQIYFLFPLLVFLFRRAGPLRTTALALAAGYAIAWAAAGTRIARAYPYYLGLFALGMLAAHFATGRNLDALACKIGAGAAFALAFFAAVQAGGVKQAIGRWPLLDLLVGAGTACALVAMALDERSLARRFFGARPLAFAGGFSYSLYLMHPPLLQIFWQFGLRRLPVSDVTRFGLLCTVGAAGVLALSYLFHLAFEAPFMTAAPAPRVLSPDPT
jgi:peptidoglycan/LPS O-acetylase OafA/YrhL